MLLPTIRTFVRGIRTHPFLSTTQYFEYARLKQLKTNSTVFNGTSYELTSLASLTSLLRGIKLIHVGGTNDNGIDLSGTWDLPASQDHSLNVLVQCKNYSTKITAKEIRELPGIFHAEFTHANSMNSIMLFCAPNILTKNGVQQIHSSNIPIGYLQIEKLTQVKDGDVYDVANYQGGKVLGFVANVKLIELLEGSGIIERVEREVEVNS